MVDQLVHLSPEVAAGPAVVDHDVGMSEAGGPVDLTADPGSCVVLGVSPLLHQPADREFRIDVDHDEQVEVVAPRLDEQGDVQDHRPGRLLEGGEPSLHLGADRRMHDGIEAGELVDVGEDPVGEPLPVEFTGLRDDVVAERRHDLVQGGLPRLLEFAGDRIGVDDREPAVVEHPRDRGLPASDTAGESDEVHAGTGYRVPVRRPVAPGGS